MSTCPQAQPSELMMISWQSPFVFVFGALHAFKLRTGAAAVGADVASATIAATTAAADVN
jgi:hypothetical protein